MDVPVGERWHSFVAAAVETCRYVSASDVVTEGLRLLQEREERLQALRESIDAAIAKRYLAYSGTGRGRRQGAVGCNVW